MQLPNLQNPISSRLNDKNTLQKMEKNRVTQVFHYSKYALQKAKKKKTEIINTKDGLHFTI